MRHALLTSFGLAAGLALATTPTRAEQFKCPHVGGDFTFGQEANINGLDQMTSGTISTRNIAMNIFESLMTRDENFSPILELADSMTESPDHLTYTFKLRQGIRFHNGKEMTSADVVASFDRYAKIGLYRSTLGNVDRWTAPCVLACPYNSRFINPLTGTADKCDFCYHRITKGLLPACVDACTGKARIFGDMNDPQSEVSLYLAKYPVQGLRTYLDTKPKVHYVYADEAILNLDYSYLSRR